MMILKSFLLFISCFLQESQCFLTQPPFSRIATTRHPTSSSTQSFSRAFQGKNATETEDFVFDVADLFGIAVAAQLLGLQDVLGETSFWQGGGWFQPITIESGSSVLSEFLQRFSIMSSIFLGASWIIGTPKELLPDNPSILQFAIKTAAVYGMLRFLLEVVTATILNQDIVLAQTLRETYVIALASATTRYVLNNFLYR